MVRILLQPLDQYAPSRTTKHDPGVARLACWSNGPPGSLFLEVGMTEKTRKLLRLLREFLEAETCSDCDINGGRCGWHEGRINILKEVAEAESILEEKNAS